MALMTNRIKLRFIKTLYFIEVINYITLDKYYDKLLSSYEVLTSKLALYFKIKIKVNKNFP